jgi:hypothetical protein
MAGKFSKVSERPKEGLGGAVPGVTPFLAIGFVGLFVCG